jgi:hypothetical protein
MAQAACAIKPPEQQPACWVNVLHAALTGTDVGGFTVGDYSADVAEVCKANCGVNPAVGFDITNQATYPLLQAAAGCSGNAPAAEDIADINLK